MQILHYSPSILVQYLIILISSDFIQFQFHCQVFDLGQKCRQFCNLHAPIHAKNSYITKLLACNFMSSRITFLWKTRLTPSRPWTGILPLFCKNNILQKVPRFPWPRFINYLIVYIPHRFMMNTSLFRKTFEFFKKHLYSVPPHLISTLVQGTYDPASIKHPQLLSSPVKWSSLHM